MIIIYIPGKVEKTEPRQFGFLSMLLGLDEAENSTIGYPDDRSPPKTRTTVKPVIDSEEDNLDSTEDDKVQSSPSTTNSINAIQSTTEKSFFDVLREGLDMIDNHSERIGTIIDSTAPNKTKIVATEKPTASFLDLLLGPDDDDEDYESWKKNQTTPTTTTRPSLLYYQNVNNYYGEHIRPDRPPSPHIVKPQTYIPNELNRPTQQPAPDSIMAFIPIRQSGNSNTLKIIHEDVSSMPSTTTQRTTIIPPQTTQTQAVVSTTERMSTSTTSMRKTSSASTTIKPSVKTTSRPKTTTSTKATYKTPTTTNPITTTEKITTTTSKPTTTRKTTTKITTTTPVTTTKVSTTSSKSKRTTTQKPITTTTIFTTTRPPTISTTKSLKIKPPTTAKPKSTITTTFAPKTTIKIHTPIPEPEESLKITNTFDNDDIYDYNNPTLPPSLPNLKIIPFLPTDAVKNNNKKVTYNYNQSPGLNEPFKDPIEYDIQSRIQNESNKRIDYMDEKYSFTTDHPEVNQHVIEEKHKNVPDDFEGIVKFVSTKYATGGSEQPVGGYGYVENVDYSPNEYSSENPILYRFSPPTKTEGGFKPRDPTNDSYYNLSYSTTAGYSKLGEFDSIKNNHSIDRFDSDINTNSGNHLYSLLNDKNDFLMNNYSAFNSDHDIYEDDLDIISITTDTPVITTIQPELIRPTKKPDNDAFFGSVLSYLFNDGELPSLKPNQTINITSSHSHTIPPFRILPTLPKIPEMFDSDELIESQINIKSSTPLDVSTELSTPSSTSTTDSQLEITTEKILPVYSSMNSKVKNQPQPPNPIRVAPKIENINLLFPRQNTPSSPDVIGDDSINTNVESHVQNQSKEKSGAEILTKPSMSIPGLLKLAGCNIYGRMYRVGKIISELSGPCLECKCTEIGVNCTPLKC